MKSSDITLTKKLRAQLMNLKNVEPQPDEDAPEITDWSQAHVGKFYRSIKKQITLRGATSTRLVMRLRRTPSNGI